VLVKNPDLASKGLVLLDQDGKPETQLDIRRDGPRFKVDFPWEPKSG